MRILIVRNDSNAGAVDAALMLGAYLGSQGISFTSVNSYDLDEYSPDGFDMAVALGGDGTMLRTARLASTTGMPILGLNFGHLGFLANRVDGGVVPTMAAALADETTREERTNLRIEVLCEGDVEEGFDVANGDAGEGNISRSFFALNEMALTRGSSGRIIDFDLKIAGAHVADMRGDGLIAASATGSTAYALSAGGPLVAPGFKGLVVVPVAPHTLLARAVVTDPNDIVEVSMGDGAASREAVLFVDGAPVEFDAPIRRIKVLRGSAPTVLLRYRHEGFYAHASKVFF